MTVLTLRMILVMNGVITVVGAKRLVWSIPDQIGPIKSPLVIYILHTTVNFVFAVLVIVTKL